MPLKLEIEEEEKVEYRPEDFQHEENMENKTENIGNYFANGV